MKVLEKLLDYVTYETTSNPNSFDNPSSSLELVLAKHLVDELKKYGCNEAFLDDKGYVYGTLKGNDDFFSLGLIAHMDTSSDASGKNVKAKVIENYDGKDIILDGGLITKTTKFPFLSKYVNKTLVVSDGTTLLGADDKAGIAIIFEVLDILNNNPNIKHGEIKVCITPDEEIGRGADFFNYDYFDVDYCYTIDGSDFDTIAYENFNAAHADVNVNGVSVHTGSAKDKMINAINVAHEFHSMLDSKCRPEHTENKEGFIHIGNILGSVEKCSFSYILRSFDVNELEQYKNKLVNIKDELNKKYNSNTVELTINDSYSNMKDAFKGDLKTVDLFFNTLKDMDIEPKTEAIRGGTDGARLSVNGLLCPNLGTGGENFHGPHEFWCKEDGEKVVEIILNMIKRLKK